jgi:hypothetical protein
MNKTETLKIGKSGRLERFLGKRLGTDYENKPFRVLLWVMLIAYVPLLIMTALDGSLLKGSVDIPFLYDFKVQFRALIAIPLMIIGRRTVNGKLNQTFNYVADKLLDEEQFKKVFAPAMQKIEQIDEKGYDELVIIIIVAVYSIVLGTHNISLINDFNLSGWFGETRGGEVDLSLMAQWQLFISMNIYRFIIVRWIWMYGCWIWILYKISKCKLNLSTYHADKVCGLNMLMVPQRVFNIFFVAMAIIGSGDLINQITYFGRNFEPVKIEMGIIIGASFVFLLAPYLLFTRMLTDARHKAEIDLGRKSTELSRRYQSQFLDGADVPEGQEKIDSSVISDFETVYEKGMGIRPIPFSLRDVVALAIPIALAFLPTLLTFMTLKELLSILLGFLT